MAYENLCKYCFKDLGGEDICPHCGKDARAAVPHIQLLPGTLLHNDRFLVGRALGQDATGVVYTALDTRKGTTIRIREYLPRNCADRMIDGTVVPLQGMEEQFASGMKRLRSGVENVDDPKQRHFYFEQNGTAYIAQRKSAAETAPETAEYADAEDEDADRRKRVALYIAIAAAVVIALAIGVIWFLNSMSDAKDDKVELPLPSPSPSASADATWQPLTTPTPTPYATATFAPLVDPELSWMDYTYSGNVNQEYQQQVEATTKRPTVTAIPTLNQDTSKNYNTIGTNSDRATVTRLQEYLAELGWLSEFNVSGKYDSNTKRAVAEFQEYVNNNCAPAKKLTVDGIAGPMTQQWLLNASVKLSRPTATPKPTPTPTPSPTPMVTPKAGQTVVDGSSQAYAVKQVQNKLIELGLLKQGSADGKYGSSTTSAVKSFQKRVNQILGYNVLETTGKVDELTMAYLDYYVEQWHNMKTATASPVPTATPKPTPTPVPTATPVPTPTPEPGTITQDSPAEDIVMLEKKLNYLGLLTPDTIDEAWGESTSDAVREFQSWVNQARGTEVLKVNGMCDPLTMQYIDYCVEHGMLARVPEVTQGVYEPEEDVEESAPVTIDAASPTETVRYLQEKLSAVGLLEASNVDGVFGPATENAIKAFQQFANEKQGSALVEVSGICDETTLQLLEYCVDHNLSVAAATATPTPAPADGVNPESDPNQIEYLQQLLLMVGLGDSTTITGKYDDATVTAITRLQQYINEEFGEGTLEVNGICNSNTLEYLNFCVNNNRNLGDIEDVYTPSPVPTAEPTPEPTEEPTPEPTRAVAQVVGFDVRISGGEAYPDVTVLQPGEYDVSWAAESGVQSYYAYLLDANGNEVNKVENTDMTGFHISTNGMRPGVPYEIRVGAIPDGGTREDVIWKSLILQLEVPQVTEVPTPEPTAVPTPEPYLGRPVITLGSAGYQQNGVPFITDSTIILSWMAEGNVDSYTVTLVNQDNGQQYSLGETTETSKTVPTSQLPAGLYTLYVTARVGDLTTEGEYTFGIPAPEVPEVYEEEEFQEEIEPEYIPEPETHTIGAISVNSDPADITQVQMKLYEKKFFDSNSIDQVTQGVLDTATLEAIAEFQMTMNSEYGMDLPVLDPYSATGVDEATIRALMNY